MVTFLMVERGLVTFTETVTASPNAGDVGLMIGVPITGGCEGGACARATEPATKARIKKSIGRLRLVVMFITIMTEGGLDFDAVTITLWNVLVFAHGMNRLTLGSPGVAQNAARCKCAPNWSLGRGLNPRPCGAECCHSAYEADALCCETHLPG